MNRLLITGCMQSGIPHVVALLQASGVKVAHNKDGVDGSANWRKAYSANEGYDLVIHHVREPLVTIEECMDLGDWAWKFIHKTEARISPDDSVLLKAMKYWLYWNQRAQAASSWTYRLESMPGVLDKVLEAIGADPEDIDVGKMSKDFNKRRRRREAKVKLTFDELLEEDRVIGEFVLFMSRSYGYKETI